MGTVAHGPGLPAELLRQREAVAQLLAPEDAARTWLVGGVVRDALLGRPLLDLDLATAADPEVVARAVARGLGGTPFPLGDEFGCWRVAVPADGAVGDSGADGLEQVDVCAVRGGELATDLAARDFTANALATPVLGEPRIVDEHGGVDDLERGVLRVISAASLDDDPLRMLRAARIAHVLDWDIEPATVELIRARAHRATEPAGERTFAELRLLLLHPEVRRGWRGLERLGLDAVLLPELDRCRGMAQSRFHHLDVHDHTLAVLDNCEDLLAATDFWLPLPQEPGLVANTWSEQQRLTVLLAALCHDLGKPDTRTLRDDGRVSFVGHDEVGVGIVDAIAARWRWSTSMRQGVGSLVATHLALGFLLHTDRSHRERWRLLRRLEPVAAEAIVLSIGDRLATAGADDRRKWVRAHLELGRQVWADHWREQRDGQPAPLLDGHAIAGLLGIAPGPRVGTLVRALAEAQAVGDVQTHDDAEQLVRELGDPD
ncbi:MAG: polynucleotide adenylyltransferase/metal dependent phosphohydrolase [Thermoleophilia bacterium]|nr:polynucleotide adenylyltransferase/metal dependent phosphohydrolase [Thermoleophilia bacterium]